LPLFEGETPNIKGKRRRGKKGRNRPRERREKKKCTFIGMRKRRVDCLEAKGGILPASRDGEGAQGATGGLSEKRYPSDRKGNRLTDLSK